MPHLTPHDDRPSPALDRLLSAALVIVALSSLGCAQLLRPYQLKKKGEQYEEKGRDEQALRYYKEALKLKPDDEDLQKRVARIEKRQAEKYTKEASELLAQQDYKGAVEATRKALAKAPRSEGVKAFAADLVKTMRGEASRAVKQDKDYGKGLKLLGLIYDGFPLERAGLERELTGLKHTWATDLSKQAAASKHPGEALLLYAKAAELEVKPEHVSPRDKLRDKLLEEHLFTARFAPGSGAAYDSAVSALTRDDWVANVRAVPASHKGQVDVVVSYKLGGVMYDTTRRTREASKRYQSGTREAPNPQYKSRQDEVARREREVARREQDVARYEKDLANYQRQVAREGDTPGTSTMAEQGVSRTQSSLANARSNLSRERDYLARARQQLADTKPTYQEPVYDTLRYTITTHTLTASAPLTLKADLTDSKLKDLDSKRRLRLSASDDEHAGYSVANVSADPLNLPSRSAMSARITSAATNATASIILSALDAERATMLERAKVAADAGERVHWLTVYTLMNPAQVDPLVPELLSDLRGIHDAVPLLKRVRQGK